MITAFRDRHEAGQRLAEALRGVAGKGNVLVLGLPRGGVPVAYEVARAIGAPLDVFIVRKLGIPGHEELAMGAIASGGVRVLDAELIRQLGLSSRVVNAVTTEEARELQRRERSYRGARAAADVRGKTVVVVDDGLATGSSMQAAVTALRQNHPSRIIAAAPVGSLDACRALRQVADECVCLLTPEPFHGVGLWYADFGQTTDAEVHALLAAPQAEFRTLSAV